MIARIPVIPTKAQNTQTTSRVHQAARRMLADLKMLNPEEYKDPAQTLPLAIRRSSIKVEASVKGADKRMQYNSMSEILMSGASQREQSMPAAQTVSVI